VRTTGDPVRLPDVPRELRVEHVEAGARRRAQRRAAHVVCHADDGHPRHGLVGRRAGEAHAAADRRALARKEDARHLAAHHHDGRPIGAVGRVEAASFAQADAQRAEDVGARDRILGRGKLRRRLRPSLDLEEPVAAVAGQRQVRRGRRGAHPGQRAQAVQRPRIEPEHVLR
jgi:hypothetical protein